MFGNQLNATLSAFFDSFLPRVLPIVKGRIDANIARVTPKPKEEERPKTRADFLPPFLRD